MTTTPPTTLFHASFVDASRAPYCMSRGAPLVAASLEAVEASDIVVVRGSYDHVELVLGALELPHTLVDPDQVVDVRLRPEQLLVVNCPGNIGGPGITAVRRFVEAGGSLFSTDW